MLDAAALRRIIEAEKPDFVVPEIEAIATEELLALEAEGVTDRAYGQGRAPDHGP